MIKKQIKATDISLTSELSAYLEKRIEAVGKFLDQNDESVFMQIELSRITRHHQTGEVFSAEINLHTREGDFRAEANAGDLNSAIDMVKDEIMNELRSKKTKRLHLLRRGALKAKNMMKGLADYYRKFRD